MRASRPFRASVDLRSQVAREWAPGLILALVLFFIGAAMPFSFAPFRLVWLQPLLLALFLIACLTARSARLAFQWGLSFGLGQYVVGQGYVFTALHAQGQMSVTAAGFFYLALAFYLALYHALFASLVWRTRRPGNEAGSSLRWIMQVAALWFMCEWLRGWLFTGFPGFALGYAHVDSELRFWAQLGGVQLTGFCVMWMAAALASCAPGSNDDIGAWVRKLLWSLAFVCLPLTGAGALSHLEWTHATGRKLTVALVQGNHSTAARYRDDGVETSARTYFGLLDQGLEADLFLFPEDVMPMTIQDLDPELPVLRSLETLLRKNKAHALFGISYWRDPGSATYSMSMLHLLPWMHVRDWRNAERVEKRHLIPFMEYLPAWLSMIDTGGMGIASNTVRAGAEAAPVEVKGIRIAISQCYEFMFGQEIRAVARHAGLLVNAGNDAWFVDTHQPALADEIARMRAIETGRTVVRVDNVGISGVIRHDGTTQDRLQPFTSAVLLTVVEERVGSTPFMLFGEGPWIFLFSVVLCCGIRGSRLGRRIVAFVPSR